MKKIYFILLFVAPLLVAQNKSLDSLQHLLQKEPKASVKFELLKNMIAVADQTDFMLANDYARQGVILAQKKNDAKWLPQFHEMLGRNYANQLQLDSASAHFDKALKGYLSNGDKKGQATTYFKMGWVSKKRGDFEQAMEGDLKALKLMESIGDKKGIAAANIRISEDLVQQERYKEALDYADKNIAYCKQNGLKEQLAFSYFSAGDAAIRSGDFKKSYFYLSTALKMSEAQGLDKSTLSDMHNSVGNALKRLRRYKEALVHYQTAMAFAKELNYGNAIQAVTANLGEVNLLMGNYREALPYQLETVKLQEASNDISNLTENYGHVSTIYEKLGNYPLALHYEKKARAIRDSVNKRESDKVMSGLLTQYEAGKREATIAAQKSQISQQRMVQWLSIGVATLLAILLIFGHRSYKERTKSNTLLSAKNAENELLMREIHHRVKNNLELVKSLLALQSAHLEDSAIKDAMLESQNRVQSMGIIHQKLYQGDNLGSIEMKDYFLNLSEGILDSFNAEEQVKIECVMSDLELDIDTAVPIGLIVNELLTNALKYAFPENAKGNIQISLEQTTPRQLTLKVVDNGIGKMVNAATKGTGFGTQLIQLLTQQLNGTMHENAQYGTETLFYFKTKAAA
jgi:two-component sensor histidine kinase